MAHETLLLKLVLVVYLSTGGVAAFLLPRLASPLSQESRSSENDANAGGDPGRIWADEDLLQQEQLQLMEPGEAAWSSEGQGFPKGSDFLEELWLSSDPGPNQLVSQRVDRSVSSVADHAVMQKRGRLLQELARQNWLSALLQDVGSVGARTERSLGPSEPLSVVLNGGGVGVGGLGRGVGDGGVEESRRRATVAEDGLVRQKSKYLADVHRQSWINAIVRKLSS
ncbi:uncharacterized protein LOC116939895 [Petromyzon marinus]|uniref:uncharacterized protein LOC116939895 n=1 Tax=Petromyzon marinus TaxID=7757 RepID=UPI003F6FF07C